MIIHSGYRYCTTSGEHTARGRRRRRAQFLFSTMREEHAYAIREENSDAVPEVESALNEIYITSGRPGLLEALKSRGFRLPQRQAIATKIARLIRAGGEAEEPTFQHQQPERSPLSVVAEAGLCNKLRVMLSYREVAQAEGRHLVVIWAQGGFCPAQFSDLFEPISGMTVLNGDVLCQAIEPALLRMQLPMSALRGDFHTHPAIAGSDRGMQHA